MKTVHKNAVVKIHGETKKETIKAAAEKFLKEVHKRRNANVPIGENQQSTN